LRPFFICGRMKEKETFEKIEYLLWK
jgi:hypothetical protein